MNTRTIRNSNKLNAMMIIFITASPLGSLIRIFMLIFQYFHHDNDILIPEHITNINGNNTTSLSSSLSSYFNNLFLPKSSSFLSPSSNNYYIPKNNSTLSIEEIFTSLFHHYAIPINTLTFHSNTNIHNIDIATIHHRIHQDLQMVIPWIFAFTTLIIIPLSMLVCNALWRRGDMENNYRKERMGVYQRCLEKFQKELDSRDVIVCIDAEHDGDGDADADADADTDGEREYDDDKNKNDNEDSTFIIIPKPGVPYNPIDHKSTSISVNSQSRQITEPCAICLSTYDKGDTVVWSSYLECPHVYHLNCIQTWIQKTYTTSCPCCRRNFIDSGLYHKVKYECSRKSPVAGEGGRGGSGSTDS
jgi:hypothetical protein